MYVEDNRRVFRHVFNFKTFVNELYSVRMYKTKLNKWRNFRKQKCYQNSIKYTPFCETRILNNQN